MRRDAIQFPNNSRNFDLILIDLTCFPRTPKPFFLILSSIIECSIRKMDQLNYGDLSFFRVNKHTRQYICRMSRPRRLNINSPNFLRLVFFNDFLLAHQFIAEKSGPRFVWTTRQNSLNHAIW